MNKSYIYKHIYENGLYSDFKIIINEKEYNLHSKFLIIKSEFFKCLFNNPQMNITDPITIIGLHSKKIKSKYIDNIIEWFYHNNIDYIVNLNSKININYKFKYLLEYYFISDFLQISELIDECKKIIQKYFDMLYNFKENIENILLDTNNNTYYYKFKKNNYYIDIDNHLNFISLINPIILNLNEYNNILPKNNLNYDNIFLKFIINLPTYDDNMFDNYDMENRRLFIKNIKNYIDNLYNNYYNIYSKLLKISFYDLNILLKNNDNIHNSVLIRLFDYDELIIDNKIIKDYICDLEYICKKYNIYDEFILKMNYFFENYKYLN